jgi:ADP-ribosylglycohydrolase
VIDTLELALWAFERTDSFADGALLVANAGENSDVAGAVYGQLAGAYYGVEAIPAAWRNSLIKKDLVESLALRLLDQTKVGAAG